MILRVFFNILNEASQDYKENSDINFIVKEPIWNPREKSVKKKDSQ